MPSPRPRPDSIWQVRVLFSVGTRAAAWAVLMKGAMGTWPPLTEIMCKFMYIVIKEFRKWERFNRFRDPGSKGPRTACGWELPWPASNGGDQRSPALPPIIQWFKKFAKFSTELKVLRPESNWGHRIISFQWQWRVGGTVNVLRYVQNTTFLPTKEQYKILSMSLRSSCLSVYRQET